MRRYTLDSGRNSRGSENVVKENFMGAKPHKTVESILNFLNMNNIFFYKMIRFIFICLVFTLISLENAYGDLITPFTENNSIDIINGEVWVACHFSSPHCTKKGYIYRFDPNKNTWKLVSFPSPVLSICHFDSTIWIGSYGRGIFMLKKKELKRLTAINNENGKIRHIEKLYKNYVNALLADSQYVYCATVGGLAIYKIDENKWMCFDSQNSPLLTSYLFDLVKLGNKIWVVSSNYWYVHYEEYPMGDENGNLASFDIQTKKWEIFNGRRRKFKSDTLFIELEGDIPIPNSNFSNVTVDNSGNIWFTFQGGVGVYRDGVWEVYTKTTCGVDFGHITDISAGKLGVWVACSKGVLAYDEKKDMWISYQKENDKIPGNVVTSIYVRDSFVWIKSYDPNFWDKQGLSPDPAHEKLLKEKGEFYRLIIDDNIVDIKCVNKNEWKKLYNPGHMEYLTLYKNGKWKSWELTRMLIDDLTK